MSGRAFYIVVFLVLRPPDPFPTEWSAASLRASGVAYIVIIFVVRIISAFKNKKCKRGYDAKRLEYKGDVNKRRRSKTLSGLESVHTQLDIESIVSNSLRDMSKIERLAMLMKQK